MSGAATDWNARFTEVWSTRIIRLKLPDSAGNNDGLAAVIMDMDASQDDMTVAYKGVDFLNRTEPEIRWLRGEIENAMAAYLDYCQISYPVNYALQSWPNVNRFGDYHGPHNHGWSYLSGTYYVQVPDPAARADGLNPAAITFSDPRYGAYRHSNAADPDAAARFTVYPEPGLLLLWPAPLTHFVHPNLSDDIRISISFNIVLEWSNDFGS